MNSDWPAPFQPISPPPPPPAPPAGPARWSSADRLILAGILAVLVIVGLGVGYVFLFAAGAPTSTPTHIAAGSTLPGATATAPASTPGSAATPTPSQTGQVPTASPSVTPSVPASGGASSSPLATVPPDIAVQIDAVIATVPAVRVLQPTRAVPYFMTSRDQFVADLTAEFDKENDPVQLAAQARALERLGLLPVGSDLRQLVLDLNGAAVAAFYRPDTGAFYIIDRTQPFGALDRVYVAHEYTHALQDQHFDLEGSRIKDPAEGDAALAQLSVIEGDATNTMLLWAQQNLTLAERIEILRSSLDPSAQQPLGDVPPILSRQLSFPYGEGLTFASELEQQLGWDAVNQALQHPPVSTEQILHPEKYASHETPASISLPDAGAKLGSGWSQTFVQTMGELNLQVFAAGDEIPQASLPGLPTGAWPHSEVAAGWNGDRLAMWEGPDNAWALGWILAWDTPADATEFSDRLTQLEPRFSGPTRVDTLAADRLLVVIAGDQATLAKADAALH